jgi:hypothetical protein
VYVCIALIQASLSRPTENEAAQEAGQRLGLVDSIAAALSAQLLKELRQSGSPVVAMGPAVFVAAAFANEEVYWLAMCLQVRAACHHALSVNERTANCLPCLAA